MVIGALGLQRDRAGNHGMWGCEEARMCWSPSSYNMVDRKEMDRMAYRCTTVRIQFTQDRKSVGVEHIPNDSHARRVAGYLDHLGQVAGRDSNRMNIRPGLRTEEEAVRRAVVYLQGQLQEIMARKRRKGEIKI